MQSETQQPFEAQVAQPIPPTSVVAAANVPVSQTRHPVRRAAITLVIILIVLAAASVGGLMLLKSSRAQPMHVSAYPGATISGQTASTNSDRMIYTTNDAIDKVAAFYTEQFGQSDESGCKQLFTDPTHSTAPGHVYYRCVADLSVLDVTQITTVTIVATADPSRSNGAQTQIEVDRTW
ncbi:MAG: hypothetical protein ACYDBJ_14060 [Aggregatilineales bacterium]